MLKTGGGAIVNTASVAGARQGIRVNALAPGLVETPMSEAWLKEPAARDALIAGIPIGRVAQPEDIAGMVLLLCSPLASFETDSLLGECGARDAKHGSQVNGG